MEAFSDQIQSVFKRTSVSVKCSKREKNKLRTDFRCIDQDHEGGTSVALKAELGKWDPNKAFGFSLPPIWRGYFGWYGPMEGLVVF